MKSEANAAFGTIELVFANAGATSFVPVTELTDSELDWMTEVNMKGVIWTALTFLPDMIQAGGGHILATASMAGLIPTLVPVHSAYAASKMGVIGFVRSMQLEVEEHNVVCTLYCPGGVLNGMRDNNAKYRPPRFGGPSDERMKIPARIVQGQPAEVLHARGGRANRASGCPEQPAIRLRPLRATRDLPGPVLGRHRSLLR